MDREELAVWLRLTLTLGVGNETARKLLAAFGLPENIFRQSAAALLQVVSPTQAAAIKATPPELDKLLEATWNWLQGRPENDPQAPNRRIVTLGDAHYPASLLALHDPPLMLYLLGDPDLVPGQLQNAVPLSRAAGMRPTQRAVAGIEVEIAQLATIAALVCGPVVGLVVHATYLVSAGLRERRG